MKITLVLDVTHTEEKKLTEEMIEFIKQDFKDYLETSYSIDTFEDEAGDAHEFEFTLDSVD